MSLATCVGLGKCENNAPEFIAKTPSGKYASSLIV
jgi:hypothetical protein